MSRLHVGSDFRSGLCLSLVIALHAGKNPAEAPVCELIRGFVDELCVLATSGVPQQMLPNLLSAPVGSDVDEACRASEGRRAIVAAAKGVSGNETALPLHNQPAPLTRPMLVRATHPILMDLENGLRSLVYRFFVTQMMIDTASSFRTNHPPMIPKAPTIR